MLVVPIALDRNAVGKCRAADGLALSVPAVDSCRRPEKIPARPRNGTMSAFIDHRIFHAEANQQLKAHGGSRRNVMELALTVLCTLIWLAGGLTSIWTARKLVAVRVAGKSDGELIIRPPKLG